MGNGPELVRVAGIEQQLHTGDEVTQEWLEVVLTEEERLRAGSELAKALAERRDSEHRLKVAAAAAKQEIAAHDARIGQIGDRVSTGREMRYVQCVLRRDYRLGEAKLIRCDTGEVVRVRTLTAEERQAPLFDGPDAGAFEGEAPALAKAPAAKRRRRAAA